MLINSMRRALPRIPPQTFSRATQSGNKVPASLRLSIAPSIASRRFASSSSGHNSTTVSNAQGSGKSEGSSSRWSGNAVFGVGLAAGLLGWGFAAVTMSRDGKGMTLLGSRKQWPKYASLKDMEAVRENSGSFSPPDSFYIPLSWSKRSILIGPPPPFLALLSFFLSLSHTAQESKCTIIDTT